MLYIIGLGLCDEFDITLKGLQAIKTCTRVYLEAYTSILTVEVTRLESLYEKNVVIADRDMVETEADKILENADKENVAFLVVGDPFGATTHTDLVLRAQELNIPVKSIHNASIMNAVGACGLQLYNFGQTVSIVFFTETWRPDSFYDRVLTNSKAGMHTLCLLDIKVKEQSIENLARGRKIFEPPRFMSVQQAAEQLIEVENTRGEAAYQSDKTLAVGIARLGSDSQRIVCATLSQLASGEIDFGAPLHSLVLVGKQIHFLEAQILQSFAHNRVVFDQILLEEYKINLQ